MEELEKLEVLPAPYEILELKDGEEITLRITDWKVGKITIIPKYLEEEKEIPVLRVWVPPEIKRTVPYYWDITSKTLAEGLLTYLRAPDYTLKQYRIKKFGVAPKARFTLEVTPI